MVIRHLQSARRIAYRPVAAILLEKDISQEKIHGVPVFAFSEQLLNTLRKSNIKLGIFTNRTVSSEIGFRKYLQTLSLVFPKLVYVLGDSPLNMLAMKTMDLDGHPALQIQLRLLNPFSRFVKRVVHLLSKPGKAGFYLPVIYFLLLADLD